VIRHTGGTERSDAFVGHFVEFNGGQTEPRLGELYCDIYNVVMDIQYGHVAMTDEI